jgi:SAM-dependent methyltransferase
MTRATDLSYLEYQYGDAAKLRVRAETHRLYSERPDDLQDWLLGHIDLGSGQQLVDVGCGTGWLHPALTARGVRVVGLDRSFGMVAETRLQARAHRLRVTALRADAQQLPLRDACCDRATALHMLFHVPDVRRALRELRRVLRPGGRVVVSTNAADHSRRLYELHAEAARALGYTPTGPPGDHFTLADLPVVREVFPTATRATRADAFLFRDTGAVLRFYATSRVDAIREFRSDGAHRAPLLEALGQRVEAAIARDGVFRVPKDSGCFVAVV